MKTATPEFPTCVRNGSKNCELYLGNVRNVEGVPLSCGFICVAHVIENPVKIFRGDVDDATLHLIADLPSSETSANSAEDRPHVEMVGDAVEPRFNNNPELLERVLDTLGIEDPNG